jgi:DNA-binding response OmpR family regulator
LAGRGVVLVVEHDVELRDAMGRWLEEAGYDVLACPGPSLPDYTCVAGRGNPCPLAHAADVVVLDLWLASDSVLAGTSSTELLAYYLSSERPVVGLSARHDHTTFVNLFLEDPLFLLDSPPERRELCETVTAALRGKEAI